MHGLKNLKKLQVHYRHLLGCRVCISVTNVPEIAVLSVIYLLKRKSLTDTLLYLAVIIWYV